MTTNAKFGATQLHSTESSQLAPHRFFAAAILRLFAALPAFHVFPASILLGQRPSTTAAATAAAAFVNSQLPLGQLLPGQCRRQPGSAWSSR